MTKGKEVRSAKVQVLFLTLVPCLFTYVAVVALLFTEFYFLIVLAIIYSLLGAYVCAVNTTGFAKVGPPRKNVVKVTISSDMITAATGKQYNTDQQARIILNVIIMVFMAVLVAALGWLLFILYCCNKFMYKVKIMAMDCDEADAIIRSGNGSIEDITYYFDRMIDYVYIYKNLNERKGANKMLYRAEKLLKLWERLYPEK